MQNPAVKILVNAVSEFLENKQESRYRPRDLLSLSISCISHKKEALSQFKMILLKKFEGEVALVQKRLEIYKNPTFDVDKTVDFAEMVSQVYQAFENTATGPADSNPEDFRSICLLSIKNVKIFRSIIESSIKETKLLTNCLLPVAVKVYFLDQKIDYFEYTFKKMLLKVLKRNLEAVKMFVRYCLLICKRASSMSLIVPFLGDLKYLLNILKIFGIKSRVLRSSRPLLIEQDISLLSGNRGSFNMVSRYFESQKCIFSANFARKIEERVLYTLYSDMDDISIAENLEHLDRCSSIYTIFQRAGLKDKLMRAFSLLLPQRLNAKTLPALVDQLKLIESILEIFNDKNFEDYYLAYFTHILESPSNCMEIAGYIDDAMRNGASCPAKDDIFDLFIEIVEKSVNPEIFLTELQKRLAIRLLCHRSDVIRSALQERTIHAFIERELSFLKKFKKMHSENMTKMVGDLQIFMEQRSINVHSPLLMTMCKWPMFSVEDVGISSDNPISKYKSDVFDMLKADRKTVSWVDSLSTVSIAVFDKTVMLSLFQYSIVLKLVENGLEVGNASYNQIFHMKPKLCTHFIKEEDLSVPKTYESQFNCLLDDLIIMQSGLCVLNPFFTKLNYTRFDIEFHSSVFIESNDVSYNPQAYNEARVAKLLKRFKSLSVADLLSSVGDITESDLRKTLARLQEKEIVEMSGENAKYCP